MTALLLLYIGSMTVDAQRTVFGASQSNLTDAERDAHLAVVRKAWIEVDDASDARPTAACFAEHLNKTTPFTLVDRRDSAEVILRFSALRDLPSDVVAGLIASQCPRCNPNDAATFQVLFLRVRLLSDNEEIWAGEVVPNAKYSGPDASCQYADALANDLRGAVR
ncbi:MAG: hypothetical protein ABI665_27245, partial [Vicinamibacterales bacterium]